MKETWLSLSIISSESCLCLEQVQIVLNVSISNIGKHFFEVLVLFTLMYSWEQMHWFRLVQTLLLVTMEILGYVELHIYYTWWHLNGNIEY